MSLQYAMLSRNPWTTNSLDKTIAKMKSSLPFQWALSEDGEAADLIGPDGYLLLSVHRSRPILYREHAASMIVGPPKTFHLWTDVSVPAYAPQGPAMDALNALARACRGTAHQVV
ncbi:hypothetical protein ACFP47_09970 [Nesterenkonia lacusekhoensis]|uniref:Uncharacterized protein n=2 Tax=Nesterenkonia TaxID=57494 RepID=A0A917AQ10_9MICC|nr:MULTISPECIES: hypothetical protein [Nesterenkonia]MBP2318758.1 hypothetical protein [Nesterenkonia lacusekhoensis]GGE65438.1 hypothetical protein GCM10011401_10880 [Nesterenkonia cremea]